MLSALVLAAIRKHRPSGTPPVLLACSGGIDSQVLLHAAAAAWPRTSLIVAHVHHGLQLQADEWLAFCEASAAQLGLRFLARRLPPLPEKPRSGIEAWARRLRYQALAEMAAEADAGIVLTAHHANDQLETHQLRRLRGAGPLGLGAMRGGAPLPGAPDRLLLRPFLDVARERIEDYAREHHLEWVDDPSNQDLRFARNQVRRHVAQALAEDPVGLERGLAMIDGYQQTADALRRQAREDLAACRLILAMPAEQWGDPDLLPGREADRDKPPAAVDPSAATLSRVSLARLSHARAAEAIRLWLEELGCRMPSRAALAEIMRQLLQARSAHARLRHDGRWLLRYRDRIGAAAALPVPLTPTWFRWSGETLMNVAGQQFLFHVAPSAVGVDADWLTGVDLMMDRACGKDRLRRAPGEHQRTWKNLCQERGIAPWMRAAVPVIRRGDELVYAAPFGMSSRGARGYQERAARAAGAAADGALPSNAWMSLPGETTDQDGRTGRAPLVGDKVAIEWLVPSQWARWI